MTRFVARSLIIFLSLIVLLPSNSITLAEDTQLTFTAQYRQDVAVSVDLPLLYDIDTLDPSEALKAESVEVVQNLFLSLTDRDPITNTIRPELATHWEVSEDGLVWTFYLRDDVMWVKYNPSTEGQLIIRSVVAADFVYGIKRACRPGSANSYWLAMVLVGCDEVRTEMDHLTDELVFGDTTQVEAIDDTTLRLHLTTPAGYFLSLTSMAMMAAIPQEVVERYQRDWTTAANIVTNGPFLVEEHTRGNRSVFIRNESFPADMWGTDGNVDRITYTDASGAESSFINYQYPDDTNPFDATTIPGYEQENVINDPAYQDELVFIPFTGVVYLSFYSDKPPFDDVHVRRAFSAILDREAFVEQFYRYGATPMIHFTTPGLINSPAIDEIGVGFNPEYAREQMALAGYPNCEGLPEIHIFTGLDNWVAYWAEAAKAHLGCDRELFMMERYNDFGEVIEGALEAVIARSNAEFEVWRADYPDADNGLRQVLHCEADTRLHRPCSQLDDLIESTAAELNQERRVERYREIEEGFFGVSGEFPIVPIAMGGEYMLYRTWFRGPFQTDGIFGASHWETWSVDMAAKLAAHDQ